MDRLTVLIAVMVIAGFPLKPVFDCTDERVRHDYPAMCPQASDPLITGSGHGGHGGGLLSGLLHALGL